MLAGWMKSRLDGRGRELSGSLLHGGAWGATGRPSRRQQAQYPVFAGMAATTYLPLGAKRTPPGFGS